MKVFATVLVGALACACQPYDVVLADLPGDGGMMGHHPPPCTASSDCPPNTFCEKPSCEAPTGRCVPHPVICDPTSAPVCGCNGVTYWNECFRRLAGQPSQVAGECGASGVTCSASEPCPDPEASCARLLPPSATCGGAFSGTCWVAPRTCPADAATYTDCDSSDCESACEAIRSQKPHRRSLTCP